MDERVDLTPRPPLQGRGGRGVRFKDIIVEGLFFEQVAGAERAPSSRFKKPIHETEKLENQLIL